MLMPWLGDVRAVLGAWYPGACGGEAIANILFGQINPSGKLPITFPKSEADLPRPVIGGPPKKEVAGSDPDSPGNFFDVNYTEGLAVGYRWFDAQNKQPLFPFGYGLSYTSFSYSRLKIVSGKQVQVSFTLRNTGGRAGAETAQVYLDLPSSASEPPWRLAAWQKINLRPAENQTVTLTLDPQTLSIFKVEKDAWEIVPGDYNVHVGGSSRDTPLGGSFHIAAAQPVQ